MIRAFASALAIVVAGIGFAAPAAAVDWTGFYAGVFGGANLQQAEIPTFYGWYYGSGYYYGGGDDTVPQAIGGEVGGVAGFNQQFGAFVLGAEGDVAWSNNLVLVDTAYNYATARLNWLGTFRFKAGVAVGDNAVVYGTAGVAAASIDYSVCYDSACDNAYDYGASGVRYGLTAGIGAEAMVTDNLSIDGKLLYTTFATTSLTTPYDGYPVIFGSNVVSARVGLNWHLQ